MSDDSIGLADFTDWVEQLWPDAKTPPKLMRTRFDGCKHLASSLTMTALASVLARHSHAHLEARKPDWQAIFHMIHLLSKGDGSTSDEWGQHLAMLRRFRRDNGLADISDAELWLWYLDNISWPVTHNTVTRKRKPDPKGLYAREASIMRDNEAACWVRWHREYGRELPPYLNADMSGRIPGTPPDAADGPERPLESIGPLELV